MRKLLALEADYLVIDLGAGSHQNVLDFFLASPRGIVVTTPHLSATMGAYLFLKNCVFRLMTSSFEPKSRARAMLDELRKDGAAMQRVYVPDFAARIEAEDPASGAAFRSSLARFKPRLAMNMLSDPSDAGKATRIRRSAREYLGVDIEHLGALYRDTTQDVALASRLPVVAYKPDSVIAQGLAKMAERVTQMEGLDDRPLNSEFYDDTFEAAGLEAENDFEAKIAYLETLLGTGELSANDLVETIKSQQYEITQLRRENQSLKLKVARALERGFA
jgi:flagellar biosynthesis protein FlhG